jgi:ligand-binding sensor protein
MIVCYTEMKSRSSKMYECKRKTKKYVGSDIDRKKIAQLQKIDKKPKKKTLPATLYAITNIERSRVHRPCIFVCKMAGCMNKLSIK